MKRLLTLCIALILALGALGISQAVAENLTLTVRGGWLRLRAEASFDAATIDSYYTGTRVTVLGNDGAWFRVRTPDGKSGYMYGDYLAGSGTAQGGENITAYVTSDNGKGVRLRTGPGTAYGVIRLCDVGTKVTILSSGSFWHYISVDGQKGYMMSQYLTTRVVHPTPDEDVSDHLACVTSPNGKSVNLRVGPGMEYDILTSCAVGRMVTVTGVSGAWSYVTAGTTRGYMMTCYLDATWTDTSGSTSYAAWVTSSNGKSVNLRSGPSTGHAALTAWPVGTQVTVLHHTGDWSYVDVQGRKGYMMTRYLTTTQPETGATGSYTAWVTSENGKGVFLRTGAGQGYSALGLYSVGTQVTVLSHGATWDRIRIGSREGYMMNRYLTTNGASAAPAPDGSYTAWVTSGNGKGVFLRTGAGRNFSSLGLYDVGTQVTVLSHGTAWDHIRIGSLEGFMMNQYLTTVSPVGNVITGVMLSSALVNVGETLRVTVEPAGADVACEWMTDTGLLLSREATYTPADRDAGSRIRVRVTGRNGYTGSAVSAYAHVGVKVVVPLKSVTIDNMQPVVGQTLTAGVLPAGAEADWLWLRDDGVKLGTARTYTVQSADVGHTIHCEATGRDGWYSTVASAVTAPVKATTAELRQLSGSVTLNYAAILPGVTIKPQVSVNCSELTYAWYADGVLVGKDAALEVTSAMAGKKIHLVVGPAAGSGYTGQVQSNVCLVLQTAQPATTTDL